MKTLKKYEYYFAKPKSEIVKDVLSWLLIGGAVAIASTSPYFVPNLIRAYQKKWNKYPKKKVSDTFSRLRREGLIEIRTVNHQIYISLTSEGTKKAGIMQIDKLQIKKPKRWDRKWRLLMFDVPEKTKISREALRGKLKQLGFLLFQKSVWVHPFDCKREVELLQDFFGLSKQQLRLIIAENIGDDQELKRDFNLS